MIPFTVYTKVIEPILHFAFAMWIQPFYKQYLQKIPIVSRLLEWNLYIMLICINGTEKFLNFLIGR